MAVVLSLKFIVFLEELSEFIFILLYDICQGTLVLPYYSILNFYSLFFIFFLVLHASLYLKIEIFRSKQKKKANNSSEVI